MYVSFFVRLPTVLFWVLILAVLTGSLGTCSNFMSFLALGKYHFRTFRFFSQRSGARKAAWRRRWEALQDAAAAAPSHSNNNSNVNRNPGGELKMEVDFLVEQATKEENMSAVHDLGWSLGALVLFWSVLLLIYCCFCRILIRLFS